MKKLFTLLLVTTLFISCSSDDDSGSFETKTTLTSFTEPFFALEAPKSEIISRYGDVFSTSGNNFSLGYNMEYEPEENGVVKYSFVLDNQEKLYKTQVLFYPGKENVDFIRDFLGRKYTFISESSHLGLYKARYENRTIDVELLYLDGEYSGVTVIYSDNDF